MIGFIGTSLQLQSNIYNISHIVLLLNDVCLTNLIISRGQNKSQHIEQLILICYTVARV
jgi:hypothetical protein